MDTPEPKVFAQHDRREGPLTKPGGRDDLFFAALTATKMAMVVTNPRLADNPIVFANDAFVELSGYANEEIVGRNCRFLQGPDTDAASVEAVRRAVAIRKEVSVELLNYRKDGRPFWNALFISPIVDADGELIYYFASQLDVTRRRHAEEALVHAQKMEAIGQLTGGIAHDFNNLLQVMLGHIEILDRRIAAPTIDPGALRNASQRIRSALDKTSTLTQQLLAFARKQRLEGRLTNLNGLAAGLMELARRTLGDGIAIVTDFAPDLADCRIDPTQFEAALLNILINARDAMEAQGTVTLSTRNVVVEDGDMLSSDGLEAGRYAMISIGDTGPGIAAELLSRVMEPFFTTKEEGRGTGLGLAMVHGFVKQSGGSVRLASEVGIGTTLCLYFPTVAGAPPEQAANLHRPCERGGSETILVVDDRREVLDVASRLLTELGYRVVTAGSGDDAVRLVDALAPTTRPALLFSDVVMPGRMNGYMLAGALRQRMPDIKVLLTTGYAGDVQGISSDAGPEYEVLKKPYKLDELAHRVRTVLDTPVNVH